LMEKARWGAASQTGAAHFFAQLCNGERGRFNSSKSSCA
jgi:hypothetical protein